MNISACDGDCNMLKWPGSCLVRSENLKAVAKGWLRDYFSVAPREFSDNQPFTKVTYRRVLARFGLLSDLELNRL